MKLLKLIIVVLVMTNCYLLRAEDIIGDSIKNFQVKKLQEIAAQHLVMRTEDRQKYLEQLATLKKQIAQCKEDIGNRKFPTYPEGVPSVTFKPGLLTEIGFGFFTLVFTGIFIAAAFELPEDQQAPAVFAGGISGLLSVYLLGKNFYKIIKINHGLPDKLYRKIITMESLIKIIPVVDEIKAQNK